MALFDDDSIDEVKHERALRAELQTRNMDPQQYQDFTTARQTNFLPRFKSQRFKDWVLSGLSLDPKPNPLAIEVLSCMAFETVAQVVDLALIVRRDMQGVVADPLSMTMPTVCINHETTSAPSVPSATPGGSTPLPNPSPQRSTSPLTSPPATPSVNSASSSLMSTPTTQNTSLPGASSKKKKRKKSGSLTSRDMFASQAILPSHIREALRRYGASLGPFADYSKQPLKPVRKKLLCM